MILKVAGSCQHANYFRFPYSAGCILTTRAGFCCQKGFSSAGLVVANIIWGNSHKKSKKTLQCITFYFIFIRSSTCFGRHTTHHQEPRTAPAASGFAYVEGCWPCSSWTLSATLHVCKTRDC
jgi:hypothetical protein